MVITRNALLIKEERTPLFPGWNEATGRPGQSQLGLIKYNQNLKSRAETLGWLAPNRAHLCLPRGIKSCMKQAHLVPMAKINLSIPKQPLSNPDFTSFHSVGITLSHTVTSLHMACYTIYVGFSSLLSYSGYVDNLLWAPPRVFIFH